MAVQTIPRTQFRMQLIFPLMLAIGLALGGRLFYWQILNYDTTNQRALDQKISQEPIRPQRGDILTSDGQILARETYLYTIQVVVPKDGFRYPQQLAKDLAPLLRQLRDPASVASGCEQCAYERLCRGGLRCLSYAVDNSFSVADPGCWLAAASDSVVVVVPGR